MQPGCSWSGSRPQLPGPGRGLRTSPGPGKHLGLAALLALLILSGVGAASAAPGAGETKLPVAASILPLGDFCQKIGGPQVSVTVLIPPGASPHVFEPSPAVVAEAVQARVFVYVGAGLDPWAERLVKSRPRPEDVRVVRAVDALPPGESLIRDVTPHRHQAHDHPTQEGEERRGPKAQAGVGHARHSEDGNPHVWLDPVVAQNLCRLIAAALMSADPEHQALYQANLERCLTELEALHQEIQSQVATFRIREFVSFHPSFTYFARRYGLKEAGVIEMAPGREPTPGHLGRLIRDIKRYGVKAVFAEPQLNPRVAEVIAREAGVKVLVLDPLGGRPPYGNDYLKLMRHNLTVMTQVLQ